MSLKIALKVDVCNRRSLEEGVPGLLRILGEFGVQASFFVAFGPDNSGKAVRRIFQRGFLRKMIRTRAPSTYGLKTLLYGTLLRAHWSVNHCLICYGSKRPDMRAGFTVGITSAGMMECPHDS